MPSLARQPRPRRWWNKGWKQGRADCHDGQRLRGGGGSRVGEEVEEAAGGGRWATSKSRSEQRPGQHRGTRARPAPVVEILSLNRELPPTELRCREAWGEGRPAVLGLRQRGALGRAARGGGVLPVGRASRAGAVPPPSTNYNSRRASLLPALAGPEQVARCPAGVVGRGDLDGKRGGGGEGGGGGGCPVSARLPNRPAARGTGRGGEGLEPGRPRGGAGAPRGAGTRVHHPARRRALPAPDAEREGGGRGGRGHALDEARGGWGGGGRGAGGARARM